MNKLLSLFEKEVAEIEARINARYPNASKWYGLEAGNKYSLSMEEDFESTKALCLSKGSKEEMSTTLREYVDFLGYEADTGKLNF